MHLEIRLLFICKFITKSLGVSFFLSPSPSEINVISISKLKAKCHNVNQLEKASLIGYNEYNYNIPGAVK